MIFMIFSIIGVVLFTIMLGYIQALVLTSLGVPQFIILFLGLLLGFFLPNKILTWIYKEEKEESKSE